MIEMEWFKSMGRRKGETMYLKESFIYIVVLPRAGHMKGSKSDECGFLLVTSSTFSCSTDVFFFNIHAFEVCDL